MSDYKEASKIGLRFQTTKGVLSTEQLWTLSLTDLDTLVVSLEEAYKNSKGKSFLDKRTTEDKGLKLQFDIVLDVLQTKQEEADVAREAKDVKEFNQKIFARMARAKDKELDELSFEELERRLK